MSRLLCCVLSVALAVGFGESLPAQDLIDFEDFGLAVGTFRNRAPAGATAFRSGDLALPNRYDPDTDAWRGWAISATTDATRSGFRNQYSATTGGGADGSRTYAVAFGDGRIETGGRALTRLDLTNSTYAAESMRRGDAFAKRFGGVTGRDPDFFSVTFRGWRGGQRSADSLTVVLADYRFSNPSEDFILSTWRTVDFSGFGRVDSLTYRFASSDVGAFGINTPTYLCIDNVVLEKVVGIREVGKRKLYVYPTPAADWIEIRGEGLIGKTYQLVDVRGAVVMAGVYGGRIEAKELGGGMYWLVVEGIGGAWVSVLRL